MTTAFQANAFQVNAFQIDDEETPPVIGGALYRPRKTKKQIEEEEAIIMALWMLNDTEYY